MISAIFHTIFFQPLYNGLIFLVGILPFNDVGLAIIILTIVVRFIIFPLSHRSVVVQKKMKEAEPEISRIKKKLKNNREEQTKQIMQLYRAHGISPFSGFFMVLLQLPVFIALLLLLKDGIKIDADVLYGFIKAPEQINSLFLSLIDMSKPYYLISFLAALSQFFQIRMSMSKIKTNSEKKGSFKDNFQKSMSIQMKYVMPVLIFFIAQRLASGLALYWTTSNVFAIVHEIIVAKKAKFLKDENGREVPENKKNNRGNAGENDH